MVSCNAAGDAGCGGITGANGASSYEVQGGGCNSDPPNLSNGLNPFNALVPVFQGNTYALVVANWTGSTSGYTIDFGLSSDINIYDNDNPSIQDVDYPKDCGQSSFQLVFNENIKCSSISAANFELIGPDGNHTLSLNSPSCDVGGNYDKVFSVGINPPITKGGMYNFNLVLNSSDEVVDLCDNQAIAYTSSFEVDTFSISIDLGIVDTTICETTFMELDASHPDPTVSYLWHDGSTDKKYTVNEAGLHTVTISTLCATASDTTQINYYVDTLLVNLGVDTVLCPGDSLVLDLNQTGEISYLWQDGSTNSSFKIDTVGSFSVTITDGCGLATDEINVTYREKVSVDLGEDSFLCEGESKILDAYSPVDGAGYFWNVGDFDSVHVATKPGIYSVVVYSECEQVYDEITLKECFFCEVYVPNAFSPNFDGTNDYFRPFSNCPFESFSMAIYNRWGAEVYATTDVKKSWDGTLHGKDVNTGIYVWLIEYSLIENGKLRKESIQGNVAVFR